MTRLMMMGLLVLLPSVASAQGSGAGGSNAPPDPCAAGPTYNAEACAGLPPADAHDHRCDDGFNALMQACSFYSAGGAIYCDVASAVCAATGLWSWVEDGWMALMMDVSYNQSMRSGNWEWQWQWDWRMDVWEQQGWPCCS